MERYDDNDEPIEAEEEQDIHENAFELPNINSLGEDNKEDNKSADVNVTGDTNDVKQLNSAMDSLESTEMGKELVNVIRENNVEVKFDQLDETTAALFDPNANEIVINETMYDSDPSVLAAHLAHEGTHVQWHEQGIPNSIDQEYHAFKNEDEIWKATKGDKVDDACDDVSRMIDQGEADAKQEIRQRYHKYNLPEFA